MPTHDRRDAAGRKSGSRGPKILRFEPLEGRQLLSATTQAAVAGAKAPDLIAVSLRSGPHGDWGRPIEVAGTIANQGNADAAGPFTVDIYVSTAPDRSTGAVKIGSVEFDGLKAGEQESFRQVLDMPTSPVPRVGADGAVHIGLVVDAGNAVAEASDANNLDRGVGFDSTPVLIVPFQQASLAVRSVRFDQSALNWGDTVRVTVRVENTTGGHAPASTARVVLTPPNVAVGSGNEVTLLGDLEVPELLPYQSVDVSAEVLLPPAPPSGFTAAGGFIARVVADAHHDVLPMLAPQPTQGRGVDWDVITLSPDPAATPVDPKAPRPDLLAADVLTPGATLTWGGTFQVASTITNQGAAPSGPVLIRYLLAGPNGELTNALVLGDARIDDGLAPGASKTITQGLKLPGRLPFDMALSDGLGRIVALVDPLNTVDEAEEANNPAASAPMTLKLPTAEAPGSPFSTPMPPTPNQPSPPTTPSPRLNQQQRLQVYRARLEAFRKQMEQRRQAIAQRSAQPSPFPRIPGGRPRNNA